nr:P-loop NTPase fold protein [uncultured Acetobacter sp.]
MKSSTLTWEGPNQELVRTLDEYCYGEEAVPFALMLQGTWGCGKTWLIDEFFKKKKLNRKNDNAAEFPLRVSLFGVSSATEIGDALYAELHPILAGKPGQVGSFVVRSLLRTTLRIDLKDLSRTKNAGKGGESIRLAGAKLGGFGLDGKPSSRIIVFDDLERAKMSATDILAAIHPLVSNGENRVILLANEAEITDDDKTEAEHYRRTKEKTVCLTLEVKPDFKSAFSCVSSKVKDANFHKFLSVLGERLEPLTVQAGAHNLRLLSFFIPLGETLFNAIKPAYRTENHYVALCEIFIRVYIVLIENRIYGVKFNTLMELMRSPLRPSTSLQKSNEQNPDQTDKNKEIIKNRLKNYDYMVLYSRLISTDDLESLVIQGNIHSESINASLALDNRFTNETELPSWVRVWNYALSSKQEVDSAVAAFTVDFKNRKFVALDMLHACSLYLTLHRVGQSGFNDKNPISEAKSYIREVFAEKDPTEENIRAVSACLNSPFFFAPFGRGFSEEKSEQFKEIKEFYFSEQQFWLKKILALEAITLVSLLQTDIEKFMSLFFPDYETEALYAHTPILHHMNITTFSKGIINLPVGRRIYFIGYLSKRFERTQHSSHSLYPEYAWFHELSKALKAAVVHSDGSPLFKEGLKATIASLCDSVDKTSTVEIFHI